MPVYALVVRKNGHKLKESEKGRGLRGNRDGELTADGITMTFFAFHLTRMLGRPVLDRTDLTGHYDFKLEWSPDPGELTGRFGRDEIPKPASAPDLSGPSIFTALQEQLGLKLESQKGPIETIVIDRVEKPTAN
jgi:uncharacterized protein (TIGR03435 family)